MERKLVRNCLYFGKNCNFLLKRQKCSSPSHPVTRRLHRKVLDNGPYALNGSAVRRSSSNSSSRSETSEEPETHFGFESVPEREKSAKVHEVFEQVATTYDIMNDWMSMGIHRWWKDEFVRTLAPPAGSKILDVAGGTGDIAFRILKYMDISPRMRTVENESRMKLDVAQEDGTIESEESEVTVCDISQSMLDVGKNRAEQQNYHNRIKWMVGNAEELPFAEGTFDAYTIAFGIRNVTHVDQALREAYRVLKRGGRLLVLEFSQVRNPLFAWIYDKYSFNVIPVMGQLIASDWKSYQYLVESIRMFPDQEEFREMINEAGFRRTTYRNLTNGICAIHSAFKL